MNHDAIPDDVCGTAARTGLWPSEPFGKRLRAILLEPRNSTLKKLLIVTSVLVFATTLAAGLWPFSFRERNNVSWNLAGRGLHFGDPGMAVSEGTFQGIPGNGQSIELWIEPDLSWEAGTILSFYVRRTAPVLQLRQSGDDFFVTISRDKPHKPRNVFVEHVFRRTEPVLLTLCSTGNNLQIYVNAVLEKSVGGIQIRGEDFQGILIVANAPYRNLSWKGEYLGLAFFDHELSGQAIQEHYSTWQRARADIAQKNPSTLYLFDQGAGERIRNRGKTGPDIVIPTKYAIPEPTFLVPFWKEYTPTAAYVKDLAINVFGLVPLGLCFAALFAWRAGRKRSWPCVVALGFSVSLTIELIQAYMPMRFSGTTDLITNTAGTALGAWCYLNSHTLRWLERSGFLKPTETLGR
jgi:VanZ family protein